MWLLSAVRSLDWLNVARTLASLATAVVAVLALRNWRRQDRAKREAEYLDSLIDAVHAFAIELSRPIELLSIIKIGMVSHTPSWEDGDEKEKTIKGAIAYIEKNGSSAGKRLTEALDIARQAYMSLRSLGAKGEVFQFKDFQKCREALKMLSWQFDRIQAVSTIVGSPTLNWQNPEVIRALENIMMVERDNVVQYMVDNEAGALDFIVKTYKSIYG